MLAVEEEVEVLLGAVGAPSSKPFDVAERQLCAASIAQGPSAMPGSRPPCPQNGACSAQERKEERLETLR